MANQSVFMFQNDGERSQHGVYEADTQTADQLVNDGKATRVSLGAYEEYRQKAKDTHTEYKKLERKIKENDSPLATQEVKDYELKKAYADYEQQTKQIQADYEQARQQMQADAKEKAARATINVNTSDKSTAEQVANRISLDIAGASNAAQLSEIVSKASDNIKYLSDAEKTALQGQLTGIIGQVETKADKYGAKVDARSIISTAQDVRNMDLLGVKVADQLPSSVDMEYRQLKAVKGQRKLI